MGNYISLYFRFLFFISVFILGHGTGTWKSLDLIIDKNETCGRQQRNFALAAQEFTFCSILHARPITFCEMCVHSYLDVLNSHEEILSGHDAGVECKDVLINKDRLEIIETLYTSFVQLWKKGECDYCFVINSNGTITSTLNNNTKNFQLLDESVRICITQNMKNKSSICTLCLEPYEKLNNFYNSLKESSRICMDIVDSMNASRMEWSKDMGCRLYFGTDIILIVTAVLVILIPVSFYALVKKYSSKIESRLLYQSRLTGQLNAPSTSCDS